MVVTGRQLGWLTALLVILVVGGCATPPLTPAPGPEVTPRAAVVAGALPAAEQIWGGMIVQVQNLPASTRLEVVSYPLRNQEPQTGRMTDGRFLLEVPGFLDPVDYRTGRRITARGLVARTEAGSVGETDYLFPVLVASEVHLWPDTPVGTYDSGRIHFGIGIGIGL
jgi:outer membrane lipoprotein